MSEPATLVVTDIVGSTGLWDLHAEAFKAALSRHDAALRRLLTQTQGYEIRTEGDGFRLAFFQASSALRFCLEAQDVLASLPWPGLPEPLRVRMGVFTGSAEADLDSVTGRLDFRGPDLLAAERIAEAAHGEQILVGETTVRLLQRQQGALTDLTLRPLGRWRLAGADEPVALWLAVAAGQPERERPPPRATAAPAIPSNVSLKSKFLAGVEDKLAELHDAFGRGATVVVLRGGGGVGKTALAAAFARALLSGESGFGGSLEGGIWFCERPETEGRSGLLGWVASAMDLRVEGADLARVVVSHLSSRGPCLLILDAPDDEAGTLGRALSALLVQAPQVRLLITSRALVPVPGARTVRLDPLPVPEVPSSREALAALRSAPVVEVFARRAKAALPGFRVGSNLAAILRILHSLGGLPLAIELAAARLRVLSLAELEARLVAAPLELLVDRRADRPARHATLRGLLDQSWAALPLPAQVGLARLGVLRGSFDLSAASAVQANLPNGTAAADALRLLEDAGLVIDAPEGRLRLTEPVAAYARARHARMGPVEEVGTRTRHAAFFAAYGDEDYLDRLARAGRPEALQNLLADIDNLDAAFRWAVSQGHSALASGAARAALEVYSVRGPATAGVALARQALALPDLTPEARAALTIELGRLNHQAGKNAEARTILDQAVMLASAARSPLLMGRALRVLATVHKDGRRLSAARDACDAALSVTRLAADPVGEGLGLAVRGKLHRYEGDLPEATADLESARKLLLRAGAPRHAAIALASLALTRRDRGDTEGAVATAEEALERFDEAGDRQNGTATRASLGLLLADLGRLEEAHALLSEASLDAQTFGLFQDLPLALWALGLTCLEQGDLPGAIAATARVLRAVRGEQNPYEARVLAMRAEVEARQGRQPEAAVWLARAEEALHRTPDPVSAAFVACHRAAVALCTGELGAVSAPLAAARSRFEMTRDIAGLRATTRLGAALREAQQPPFRR